MRKFIFKLILEEAIAFEERAYRYYRNALERSTMEESFDLLKKLSAEKLKHRMRLEEVQNNSELSSFDASDTNRTLLSNHDSEDIESICEEWPNISGSESRKKILQRALGRELCAQRFYRNMMNRAWPKRASCVFEALYREESNHVQWVRNELMKVSSC